MGRVRYRRAKQLDLCIDRTPLHALLASWAAQRWRARPTVVGLKLPINFALQNFETALRGAAGVRVYSTHRFSKMLLVVVVMR